MEKQILESSRGRELTPNNWVSSNLPHVSYDLSLFGFDFRSVTEEMKGLNIGSPIFDS